MSTSFAQLAATPGTVAPDSSKHVNYTLGMLLGVDDFNQEFAYLSGRDKWLARDAIGYGTLNGLRVTLDTTAKGPRVTVSAGTALSPMRQVIRLQPAQCAYLADWLSANQSALKVLGGSPPGSLLRLSLVICYRQCPTDPVPIAGEPCRSAADMMANSRLTDDFRLELRVTPPVQQEEDAVRDFVAWLDQIQVTDAPGNFPTLASFEDLLRSALIPASPPDPAAYFHFGSPLSGFHVHPADLGEYLRAAFRLWVTEIRPLFHLDSGSQGCGCGDSSSETANPVADECVLLAEVDVPVINSGPGINWVLDTKHAVTLDESRRPILLHARMQQEWMQSGLRTGK
jgi:hypothetical protein